jgi:hypothetical protein
MMVGVGETGTDVLVVGVAAIVAVRAMGGVAVRVAIWVGVIGSLVVIKVAVGLSGGIVLVGLVDSLACSPGASVASHALTKAETSRFINPIIKYRLKTSSFPVLI